MLSEEEKKAIEIFTDVINYLKKWNDNLTIIPEDKKYYEIVLNLITKLQKENEEKNGKIEKYLDIISKKIIDDLKDELVQLKNKELDLKDKQIDLIINFMYEIWCKYPGSISHELRLNGFNDDECGTCENTDKNCVKCLKEYFINK